MKLKSRLVDAFLGLLITLAVAGSYVRPRGFLESLELKYFDLRAKLVNDSVDVPENIVIVAIDDDSIARLGRWPWPRTRIAQMLEKLSKAEPSVIGLDILFSEKAGNPAFQELDAMEAKYKELIAQRQIIQRGVQFELEFSSAARRLDTDAHLVAALEKSRNVVLPLDFKVGGAAGGRPPAVPEQLSKSALSVRVNSLPEGGAPPLEATRMSYPIEALLGMTTGTGHVNIFPDQDGVVRRETPVVKYGNEYYPSFALQLVARSIGLASDEIEVSPGQSITVGNLEIPLDETQSMLITYNGDARTFRYFKFYEVLADDFDMAVFKGKIVIIGPSATGIATLSVTPLSLGLPAVEYIANVAENISNDSYITRPEWAMRAELGAIAVVGLFVMLVLPRLGVVSGLFLTSLLMSGLLGAGFYFFKTDSFWLKAVYPSFLLGVGYVVIMVKNFLTTEQDKERVEGTQADTNKQLGLQFQSQGMLDLAFEKLRTCPVDENMKETLYNLATDFERKRQYAKAVSVYQCIEKEQADFKDIQPKIKALQAAAEGAVFGGVGGGPSKEGTIFAGGGASKPTLGRYEVEKELGRGAMGIVYLGKDPKINRMVAIKTLMMEGDDDPKEAKEIKERFFREAESAGTLNHPNIVRIFDAGEDNDLCWIAMELLDGHDFVDYTKKDKLMPPEKVMEYVATVANALEYAHSQGIVHRDIKPANLMLLKDGSVRVTDFGIARITASSKTATGTIMGTPSYMSPDQVAGKKVDGRSDLFSLGVTLYELLCGEKPFKGGEGIGTLLFQIANDPEPDILTVNPKLPASVKAVIHRALMKDADERYQKGSQFAKDIRACIAELSTGAAAEAAAPPPAAEPAADPVSVAEPVPEPIAEPGPAAVRAAQPLDIDLNSTGSFSKDLGSIAGASADAPPAPIEPELPGSDVADSAAEDIAGSLMMPADTAPPEPSPEPVEAGSEEAVVFPPAQNFGGDDSFGGSGPLQIDLGGLAEVSEPIVEPVLEPVFEPVLEPIVEPEPVPETAPEPAPEPAALYDDAGDKTVVLKTGWQSPAALYDDASDKTVVLKAGSPPYVKPAPQLELPPEEFSADETLVLPSAGRGGGGLEGFTPEQVAQALPMPAEPPAAAPPVPKPAPAAVPDNEKTIRLDLDDEIRIAQAKLAQYTEPFSARTSPDAPSQDSGTGISLSDPEKPS